MNISGTAEPGGIFKAKQIFILIKNEATHVALLSS